MDGERGPLPVTTAIRLWCLFALFLLASPVFAGSTSHRQQGFDALGKGDCAAAVAHLLQARGEGDSSNPVMLRLSQALECDGRMVDALSATYAGNESDTTGRIELLLFRANLLRKIGMEDEARAVEAEVGSELGNRFMEKTDEGFGWLFDWSVTGGVGWKYETDRSSMSDSVSTYSERITISNVESFYLNLNSSMNRLPGDSITFEGGQYLASAGVGFGWFGEKFAVTASVPAQIGLASDLSEWNVASSGANISISYDWKPWLGAGLSGGWGRTWYPVENAAPVVRDDLSGTVTLRGLLATVGWSMANSVELEDAGNRRLKFYNHVLQIGRQFPKGFQTTLSGGYSWYDDEIGSQTGAIRAWVIPVQSASSGQGVRDLKMLDSTGRVVSLTKMFQILSHSGGDRIGSIEEAYLIPTSSSQSWGRWSLGGAVSQSVFPWLSWSIGFDLSQTDLSGIQSGLWVDPFYSFDSIAEAVRVFRDQSTGEAYISFFKLGQGSTIVPLVYARHRQDVTKAWRIGISSKVNRHLSIQAGWTYTDRESTMDEILDGSSYTRTVWNASTSVSW